jgi:diaminopimelate epimerase
MRLAKWQGLGNDYLIIDEAALPAPLTTEAIALLCDWHVGIGSDGILLKAAVSGAVPGAEVRMRVFNPDGSEPEMCGNGIRMFSRYLAQSGAIKGGEFTVETLAGPIKPRLLADGTVRVDMGFARFRSANVDYPGADDVVRGVLQAGGEDFEFTFVDVGNPHCIIQVDDPARVDVAVVGPLIEHHQFFPNRANVEFIRAEADGSVSMRVWERGVGETQACGTGATAVGAAAVQLGLARSPVVVHLLGGDLIIEVEQQDDGWKVFMTGPAEEVCSCELSDDLLRRLGWPAGF